MGHNIPALRRENQGFDSLIIHNWGFDPQPPWRGVKKSPLGDLGAKSHKVL